MDAFFGKVFNPQRWSIKRAHRRPLHPHGVARKALVKRNNMNPIFQLLDTPWSCLAAISRNTFSKIVSDLRKLLRASVCIIVDSCGRRFFMPCVAFSLARSLTTWIFPPSLWMKVFLRHSDQ
jgi:hypothetical protein